MAQSDLTIQNQSFPSFRSDLNDALTALNTTQSGTSRPSSAVAGTIWLDTTNATSPTLKLYDGGDDISLATLDYSANTVNWLDSTVSADLVNDLSPQLGGMLDVNGNAIGNGTEELIKFSETASAVNELTITNSATGNAPEISATGDDTNIDFKLTPKGTGKLVLDGIKFPNADGTSGQALQTDGSGNLSFASVGGTNTPAFEAYLSANQSISTSTITKVQCNTEVFDTASAYDNSSNYRFTPQTAGKYFFYSVMEMTSSSNNDLQDVRSYFYKNGSVYKEAKFDNNDSTREANMVITLTAVIDMNGSSDYVELFSFIEPNAGTATISGGSNKKTNFGAYKIIE